MDPSRGAVARAGRIACYAIFGAVTSGFTMASAGDPMRVAVCEQGGEDLPQGSAAWLSQLVRDEVAKADTLAVEEGLLSCGPGPASAAAAAPAAGMDKAVTGSFASVADLFAVELRLVDAQTVAIEAEENVEIVEAPLDPRTAVRVAAQRLVGIGGHDTLPESHIKVSSTPPGANVFVGGLLEGRAPIKVRVPPGPHSISARLPGYHPWALDVDVKDREELSLNAALAGALSATQSKSLGAKVLLGFSVPYIFGMGEGALYVADVESERPYIGWLLLAPPVAYLAVSDALGGSEVDVGRAWMIVTSGMWGATWGALGVGTTGHESARPYVAASMGASVAGLLISARATADQELSRTRVGFINTGGFMGSAVGLGIPYLLDVAEPRVYNAGLLAGGITGILLGIRLTSGMDFVDEDPEHARMRLEPQVQPAGMAGYMAGEGQADLEKGATRYGVQLRYEFL